MVDWLYIILINAALVYLALCCIFFTMQGYFFFRPEILPRNFEYRYPFPFDEITLEMEDGSLINGVHFKVPNARGVVYYLKGNSRSIKGWGKFARDFVSKGYDFFMFDYRGFGKSSGKRTEQNLYNDAQMVYKWLSSMYPEAQIVIYGRSLGSGIAARIAAWNKPRMLILDSPYYSFLYQVKRYGFWLPLRWLLRYQIRTDLFIKKITCPIFIFHGNKDRLISYHQSQMLMGLVSDRATLVTIEGGGHNNLPEFPAYHEQLYDILHDMHAASTNKELQQVA
ncbi:MAG TPA: alpha/beta fold hydrolase [Saprospiraceae bacterium]|nr:alpha/beta fold hydrolase [Saprospiraceae bacterium]HMP14992.1 alpha/beta fold hydrolase [Saprospiraceae bacterium]